MAMDSEDWKDFQKQGKIIRENRLKRHRKFIYAFCMKNNLRYTPVQEWQLRIANDRTVMDLFPMSKKYHNLNDNRRGMYYNLESFLNAIFINETGKGSGKSN